MKDMIQKAAKDWADAIESRIPENVVRLYHPEGSLWGTLAQENRHGHEKIREYFVLFLDKEDLSCQYRDGFVRKYDDFAFFSGSYEFRWKIAGRNILVPARFSFIYKKEGKEWLIMEHHSSLFPDIPFKARKYIVKQPSINQDPLL